MPILKLTYKYDSFFTERKKNNITENLNQGYSIQIHGDPIEEHVLKQNFGVS